MTTSNDTGTNLIIDDEGDFSAQFANLATEDSHNDESVVKGENNKSINIDTFESVGNVRSVEKFVSNETYELDLDDSRRFQSTARSGRFDYHVGGELGSVSPLSPPQNRAGQPLRASFNIQLGDLNETESFADGLSQVSTSDKIDHRMRRSSIGKSLTKIFGLAELENLIDEDEQGSEGVDTEFEEYITDPVFNSEFKPEEMRCLALVAHNHMKPAMKTFVLANKNLLCKFKLTGTNTTMTMLRQVFHDNPDVKYGPTCTSGPLGGDAELVAIMCTENLGGCIFFQDPMSSHPHAADIECLTRQGNVHNVLMMPNPATAFACMVSMRIALQEGRAEIIPSFFRTTASPSVAEYKRRQAKVVEKNRTK